MAHDVETDRLLALMRLADKGANGFPPERQLALDKAVALARRAPLFLEDLIEHHRIDVADLRCPRWQLPRAGSAAALRYRFLMETYGPDADRDPPSREDCAGFYAIAGLRHYEGRLHRHRMRAGDPVSLSRVIGNPHDRFAVFVTWKGLDLGHIPRDRNEAIWRFLATRQPLEACIAHVAPGPGRYGDIEVEIR
jgi:hypothetical protein